MINALMIKITYIQSVVASVTIRINKLTVKRDKAAAQVWQVNFSPCSNQPLPLKNTVTLLHIQSRT